MAGTEADRGTELGIHAIYSELFYEMHLMREYFAAFAEVWDACVRLARVRHSFEEVWTPTQRTGSGVLSELRGRYRPLELRVHHLHIGSPMAITFVLEGGAAAVALYAAHLFARVLRHPENVGAWLPRLVAGWHKGMSEAELEKWTRRDLEILTKQRRREALRLQEVRDLIRASGQLVGLSMDADEVRIIGIDKIPQDIAALDNDVE